MRWQGSWACDVCGRPAADHTPAEQQACTAASSTNVYCGACGLAHEADGSYDCDLAPDVELDFRTRHP